MKKPKLSVIVPAYNEERNVKILIKELKKVLDRIKKEKISDYEVIFVNDGSKDKTQEISEKIKKKDKNLKIIQLRKNFGQTPALKAGFDNSDGDLIVTMDSDLQNDPKDIPRLIDKLNRGYDVVSGWRYKRKDSFSKKISSRMMNNLRRWLIGDKLHDYGCCLKIYKKECIKDLELFGELHRYITGYLHIKGYKIGELIINHRQRKFGKTKYKNIGRGINGILDLLFLKFWASYLSKPLHFFGKSAITLWIIAILIVIEQWIEALIKNELRLGPLLVFASMLIILGLLFFIFGFLAEMLARIYLQGKSKIYNIEKIID